MHGLISKIDALKALKTIYDQMIEDGWVGDAKIVQECGEVIRDLPCSGSEMGEWHEVGPLLLACSKCGRVIGCPMSNAPKFCENCGKKMNGGEDSGEDSDEADAELEAWLNE